MKKIGIILAVIVVIALLVIGGFVLNNKETESTSISGENANSQESDNSEDSYIFEDEGKQLILGKEYSTLNLGEPNDYYEVQSCAFDGMDKIYTFDNYEVHTYPDNGTDKVLSIYFLNDKISTTEGIKIGDSVSSMIERYGEVYEQLDTQYTYSKGLTELRFIVEDSVISSIEYNYNVE